jgi:Flp pilus assembly pilin Flp
MSYYLSAVSHSLGTYFHGDFKKSLLECGVSRSKYSSLFVPNAGYILEELFMRALSIKRSRGQGMTEYIIIVALIAIAAIGIYSIFGNVVRNQTGAMAASLAGDNTSAKNGNQQAKDKVQNVNALANNKKGLDKFADGNDQ